MKAKINVILKKIHSFLFKDFKLKFSLISCILCIITYSSIFVAGSLSNKTIDEVSANYFAYISKDQTNAVGTKKLSGLVVEPKDAKRSKMRQDTENAMTDIWGVFKGNNATFAPTINVNKNYNIFFSDKDFSNESLSLVYSNVGGSAGPYHVNSEGEVVDYKFQSLPLAAMFPSASSGMQDILHIYISQTQAERKLKSLGKEINRENLKGLQNSPVQMIIDGVPHNCVIDNIYLDNFEHQFEFADYDYYYGTDIATVIGDFVFVVLYANKPGVFPDETILKRQSLYLMSEYSFRNKYFLEYAKKSYNPSDYNFDFARNNLKIGFVPDYKLLEKSLTVGENKAWSSLLTIFAFVVFVFVLVVLFVFKLFKQPLSVMLIISSSFVPYFVFRILYTFNKSTFLFSSYSLALQLILLSVFALMIFIFNCFSRTVVLENNNA